MCWSTQFLMVVVEALSVLGRQLVSHFPLPKTTEEISQHWHYEMVAVAAFLSHLKLFLLPVETGKWNTSRLPKKNWIGQVFRVGCLRTLKIFKQYIFLFFLSPALYALIKLYPLIPSSGKLCWWDGLYKLELFLGWKVICKKFMFWAIPKASEVIYEIYGDKCL